MLLVILLFDLLQVLNALVGPEIVIFEPGQSVNITCRYTSTPVNVHDRKFWCKISETTHGCSTVISSNMFVAGGYTNRTWLVDTPVDALFQVQMTELTQKDAGIYRCGIGLSNNGLFVSVFLAISEGPNVTNKLEKVSGRLHGSISVQCTFHESDSNKRFWCKMERTGGCRILVDTGNFINKRYMGRLLIVPGDSLGVVKILFNQLTPEDAGWYRCGSGTFGKGGKWKDVQVLVSTDTGLQGRTSILHGVPGGSAAIECHHDPLINYEHKHWCKSSGTDCLLLVDDAGFVSDAYKGRISLKTGGQSNGTFTFLLTDLRDTDRGWYWCVATDGVYEVTSTVELQIDKEISTLPSAPTDGRASGGVISKAATRARSELPHENSAIPRLSDSPQLQKPAFLLDVTSNNTVLQPGPRRESKRNLLLIVAPSLGVALLLIAVGAFVVIKTRCRKKRVREPINKKTADVALAETKILAPSAEEASPSALGEKETDLDNNDVTKGLMENAVSSSLSTDT